jgi:hypothetical protein
MTQSRFKTTRVRSLREKDPSSSETLVKVADAWLPFVGVTDLYTVSHPSGDRTNLCAGGLPPIHEFSGCLGILRL